MELRCSRRLHAKVNDGIEEIHCRRCSADRSIKSRRVKVFHRWEIKDNANWVALRDREEIETDRETNGPNSSAGRRKI